MSGRLSGCITVAGFDPSGGAGVAADWKTFEAHGALGSAVVTALTYQTDRDFLGLSWVPEKEIFAQLDPLLDRMEVTGVKVGLIQDLNLLHRLALRIRESCGEIPIVWDPILRASAGYEFHREFDSITCRAVLEHIDVITPNHSEVHIFGSDQEQEELSQLCAFVITGQKTGAGVLDEVVWKGERRKLDPTELIQGEKHGSGCVFASALLMKLVGGADVWTATQHASQYVQSFLKSAEGLLGKHVPTLQILEGDNFVLHGGIR